MSTFSVLLCVSFVLFLAHKSDGIAIRGFRNRAPSSCNTETAFAALGCPCALVGQRCLDFGSRCFGPGNSLIGNIGNGNPKRGICACGPAFILSPFTRNKCISSFISIPSASAGSCLFRDGTITTVNIFGFTQPIQYILGVVNTTITPALTSAQVDFYRVNPMVAIDRTTNQVYAIESPITPSPSIVASAAAPNLFTGFLQTVTSVVQCYQVVGVDANRLVSEPTTFCVTFSPMDPTCACSVRPCATSAATILAPTVAAAAASTTTTTLGLVSTAACVRTCPVGA